MIGIVDLVGHLLKAVADFGTVKRHLVDGIGIVVREYQAIFLQ